MSFLLFLYSFCLSSFSSFFHHSLFLLHKKNTTSHSFFMNDKERFDDLASLFLPDILHQRKPDDFVNVAMGRIPIEDSVPETPQPKPSFNDNPQVPMNPYATFLPFEGSYMPHNHGHGAYAHQLFMHYMNGQFAPNGAPGGFLSIPNPHTTLNTQQQMLYQQNIPSNNTMPMAGYSRSPGSEMPWLNQYDPLSRKDTPSEEVKSEVDPIDSPPKRKRVRKARNVASNIEIDYRQSRLKRLLDFKQAPRSNNNYIVVDKDDREVNISFSGFLNGRFLTNDIDNGNYIHAKSEQSKASDDSKSTAKKKFDAKVISCYRRNYIQILLNMHVDGMTPGNRLLKVRSDEYGYTVSRVVKYFKIEVSACTSMLSNRTVPIFIKNGSREDEKVVKKDGEGFLPTCITENEHIFLLNNDVVEKGAVDKYFTIKKVQFKSATPNNGNLTFQNYYHLRIKLSAVVADLYYDDYVDADYPENRDGVLDGNEVTLCELVSEPIIVRGRNPSFYLGRKDILIKGRSTGSQLSFVMASDDEEEYEHENVDPIDEVVKEDSLEEVVVLDEEETSEKPVEEKPVNLDSGKRYEYFPISNVYYLPPVNLVYFPHGAHQSANDGKMQKTASEEQTGSRRKGSNVYFK